MFLNDRQRQILLGVLEDRQRLAAMDPAQPGIPYGPARGAHRLRVRRAREGLVPMNLAGWIGRDPTNSDRVLFHRACVRLEGMGLLLRCNPAGGRRTTHLKLTAAGQSLARRLLDEESDAPNQTYEAWDIDWAHLDLLPIEIPPEDKEADDGTR